VSALKKPSVVKAGQSVQVSVRLPGEHGPSPEMSVVSELKEPSVVKAGQSVQVSVKVPIAPE